MKREEREKEIDEALENMMVEKDSGSDSKRRRKLQQAAALRSKIWSDLEEKITSTERKFGAKNVTDLLREAKIMDLPLNKLNELVDFSDCLPTTPNLSDGNKLLIKMYFTAVEKGLPVFEIGAGKFQTSDLKFPNDFLNAKVGLELFKGFRRGVRIKYSPNVEEHMPKFGVTKTKQGETEVAPNGVKILDRNSKYITVNTSVNRYIGSIPESFFTGDRFKIYDYVQYNQDPSPTGVRGDTLTFYDDDGEKNTLKMSAFDKALEDLMRERLKEDFDISDKEAKTIMGGFEESLKGDDGIKVGSDRKQQTDWFRSAVLDLAYLASVWALEQITESIEDRNLEQKCFDFMDSIASEADRENTKKSVKKVLTSEEKLRREVFGK